MFRFRSLALMLLGVLSAMPARAQNYQNSFVEPVFDTGKAPVNQFGDLQVDPATGRASMDIPMGPGIGGRGALYRPTLRLREKYIHTYQAYIFNGYFATEIPTPWVLALDGQYVDGCGKVLDDSTGWTDVHGGESTQSLLPGYLALGLPREPYVRGQDRVSRFEMNGLSGVLNDQSVLPPTLNTTSVLQKFGYSSSVQVGAGPGFEFQGGPPTGQFVRMASDKYLVMALTGSAAPYAPQSFQEASYSNQGTPTGVNPYWVPGAFLVVDGDVAYEFTFAYTKTDTGSAIKTAGGSVGEVPILFTGHGMYRLNRILNAFGDQVTFSYPTSPNLQIVAHWLRNGVDTGVGVTTTMGSPITVAYSGASQAISYSVGTASTSVWGSWIQYEPDHTGFWEGGEVPALPDQPWVQIPVASVVQDQTQERVDIKTVNGLPSVVYSKTGGSPTRTVSLHWSAETQFFYCQKSEARPYPGRAWTIGVDRVDDTVPGPNGPVTRTTTYDRVVPVPNTWLSIQQQSPSTYAWVPDPNGSVLANPFGWAAGAVHTCKVTRADGTSVLYTYAPPATTADSGPAYLTFVKNIPVKEEWFGANGTRQKTITYSAFDERTVGNPTSNSPSPVPYATHWEVQDFLVGRWEIHDLNPSPSLSGVGWDATNLGWTGEQVLIEDLNGSLITDRTMRKTLTSNLPYFLYAQDQADTPVDPTVRVPVSRSGFDSKVNLYTTATYGDISGQQVVLHTDWAMATGLLTDAWLNYAGQTSQVYGAAYTYDAKGFMASIAPTDPAFAALAVSQTSNGVGWPLTQVDPNALTKTFTWDAAGRLSAQALPNGELGHGFTYDSAALTVAVAHGVQAETHVYNGFGEPIRIVRDNGDGTKSHRAFGYDAGGRLIWETVWRPGDGATVDWTTAIGPDDVYHPGQDAWTEVTSQCAAWSVPDMDGNRTCLRYRTIDHPAVPATTTYVGSTHYEYDEFNRVTKVTNPNQEVTTTAYAASNTGSTKTITVAPGTAAQQQQVNAYDPLGRLVKVTAVGDSASYDSSYTYDNADRMKSVTQWSGAVGTGPSQVRIWTYDTLGRLTTLLQPESGTTTYGSFTPLGKPQTTVYGYGSVSPKTVTTTYDTQGRVTAVASSDSSVTQSFSYDQTGHGLANGKLTSATSNGVGRSLTYGGLNGRLSSLARTVDSRTFTQSMAYDASYGFLTSRTYPDGKVQKIAYNLAKGLPVSAGFGASPTTSDLVNTISYDPTGWMLTQLSYANAASSSFTYRADQMGLASMTHTIPGVSPTAWAFSYNEAGQLGTNGEDWYSYDKLGRLTQAFMRDPLDPAAGHGIQQTFSYDAFGNRTGLTSKKVSNWTAPLAPPGSPTLTGLTAGDTRMQNFSMTTAETTTLAATNHLPATVNAIATGALYDLQGNLTRIYQVPGTSGTQLTMTYDALGQVTTLGDTAHATSQTYGFDDEGLRIKILDSATGLVSYNIYDEGRKLIAQYTVPSGGSLTWKKDLVYVGAKEVAEVDSAGKTWVQFLDHLGSPRLTWDGTTVTSVDGVHLIAQKYAPFGEYLSASTTQAKFGKGFTNHEQTDANGLVYMQARFYAPMYGRFLSPDPARDQHFEQTQSWNIYSYVRNSPTMMVDPTGMIGGGINGGGLSEHDQQVIDSHEKAQTTTTVVGGYVLVTDNHDSATNGTYNATASVFTTTLTTTTMPDGSSTSYISHYYEYSVPIRTLPDNPGNGAPTLDGEYTWINHPHKGVFASVQIRNLDGSDGLPTNAPNPGQGGQWIQTTIDVHPPNATKANPALRWTAPGHPLVSPMKRGSPYSKGCWLPDPVSPGARSFITWMRGVQGSRIVDLATSANAVQP